MELPQNAAPGFNCPNCDFTIRLGMYEVLVGSEFRCHGCGLTLTLDREASRKSLQLLQDLHVALQNVESVRKQSL